MIGWLCLGFFIGLLIVLAHECYLSARQDAQARARAQWAAEIDQAIRNAGGTP